MKDHNKTTKQLIKELMELRQRVTELDALEKDHKRIEEALRETEERYRLHFENVSDVIYSIDPEFKILTVSPSVEKILGYRLEELIGKPLKDLSLLAKDSLEAALSDAIRVLASERITSSVYEFIAKDGTSKFGEVSGTPLIRGDKIVAVVGVVRDITERKRAEERIHRQTALLEAINKVLLKTLTCKTEVEVVRSCLAVAEELTGSKFGWIGEVNQDGTLDAIAESDTGWEACKMPESEALRLTKNMEIRGIWGAVIREGQPLIANDPFCHPASVGIPEGHPPLTSFLGVPLKRDGKTYGMIALANKESGYDLTDQKDIETLSIAFVEALNRKRAEEALHESENRFRQLAENIREVFWMTDPKKTQVFYISPAYEQIWGCTCDSLYEQPRSFADAIHPEDRERVFATFEQQARGEAIDVEYRITQPDGSVRWIWSRGFPVRDERGELYRVAGIAEDITERKRAEEKIKRLNEELERRVIERTVQLDATNKELQAEIADRKQIEEALRKTQDRLNFLISHSPAVIYTAKTSGDYGANFVSENVKLQLGYDPHEFVESSEFWINQIHPEDVPRVLSELLRLFEQEHHILEYRFLHKGGAYRWIRDEFRLIRDQTGNPKEIIGAHWDITDRKRAEEELRKYQEHLEELVEERAAKIRELESQRIEIEKLAAAGMMAARIAHEINNPLAGIKNSFLLVKEAVPNDHLYYEYVGRIEKEINRIARIVRQMFEVYRPEQEMKSQFSIDNTIRDVVVLLEATWRESNVTIEIDTKSIVVNIPEGSLRQLLYNILLNAIEASPQGGVIKIAAESDDKALTLSVSDQGAGIPTEIQSRIFEPFFTTKERSRKGLGLGLSVSKEIVETLGGHIDFESETEKGTVFRINLPLRSGGEEVKHD